MKLKKILILTVSIFLTARIFAQTRPIATEINAFPGDENNIIVKWRIPDNVNPAITGFYVYRDSRQISSYEQLENLKPVARLASDVLSFTDQVKDNREYFYCVIASTHDSNYTILLPSINTTIYGVRIRRNSQPMSDEIQDDGQGIISQKPQLDASEKMRDIPLPRPGFIESPKKTNILGEKALSVSSSLGKDYLDKKNRITKMHIFEEDLIAAPGGDDYSLFKILKESFVKKDFGKAVVELTDYLSVRRSKEATERATFYLGEAYYFSKNYQEAIFRFLLVQDKYPELSKKWIDSGLDLIDLKE